MEDKFGAELRSEMKERLYEIRVMIDDHVEQIHSSITDNAKQTLKFIQMMLRTNKSIRRRPIGNEIAKLDPSMFVVRRLWDQVAAENEPTNVNDFDVAINYQPRNSRSQKSKEQPPTKAVEAQKTNSEDQKKVQREKLEERKGKPKEQKKKPRVTKGEAVEEAEKIMAFITKHDDKQIIIKRISKNGEQFTNDSSQTPPPSMVELIMVNAKIDRLKRNTVTINNKMVSHRSLFLNLFSSFFIRITIFRILGFGSIRFERRCRHYSW